MTYIIHGHNDWFVCHSDKVEIEGSTPSLWTIIEVWCNWFTRHSDKVEFGGSSPFTSTKDTYSNFNPIQFFL